MRTVVAHRWLSGLFLALWTALACSCSGGDDNTRPQDVTPQDIAGDQTLVDLSIQDAATEQDDLESIDTTDLTETVDVVSVPTQLVAGDVTLRLDLVNGDMVLSRGGRDLVQFPASALSAGIVKALDEMANYDPYALLSQDVFYTPPEGLLFLPGEFASWEAGEDGNSVILHVFYPETTLGATVEISVDGDNRFRFHYQPEPLDAPIAFLGVTPTIDEEEGLYGLGEFFDTVNHRGRMRAMQLEADGSLESAYNEAHVPVPFLLGTTGWGLFVESRFPGVFDCPPEGSTGLAAVFGTGVFSTSQGLTFYLMAEDHPLDVTNHYYRLTGYPRLPARWALGPWVWRDENDNQAQVESDLNAIRDLDLPTSGYWIDRPYATGVNTFDFNAPQFPDPDAMIALMHSLGFRTALWHTPYLDKSADATLELRTYAEEQGFYPPAYGMLLNKWGKPIDFTNPEAYDWWQGLIRRYSDMGIEGFKLDYAEDVVPGISSTRINLWEFFDGSDERTMHSLYNLYYHQIYAETLPEDGGFLLCRHGAYGDQVNGPIIWPGDLDANFAAHGQAMVDEDGDEYNAVGGVGPALIGGLTLGPSGFPFYGSDTGGYRHSPPEAETFIRWFESTAVSTVMQIGTSSNDVAWEFFDEENDPDGIWLNAYRTYTRLHLRLFPYEWTYAQNLLVDGRAIQRPLGLAYPEMGIHPSDVFLFGDDLLVAPVVTQGAISRTVPFPPGNWMDWWTGEVIAGNQELEVPAPLETLPLYLRQGAIVPMLRPTIDTLSPTDQTDRVDSYETTPGVLYVLAYPGGSSSFSVFDGMSLAMTPDEGSLQLQQSDGSEFTQGTVWELCRIESAEGISVHMDGEEVPVLVDLDDLQASNAAGWFYQEALGGRLFIRVPSGTHTITVTIP